MMLQTLYIIAIISEAITGTLAAGRHKMDLFGVLLIALVTAIGGGTIRDIVLNMHPVTWVSYPEYVILLCLCSMLTTKIPYFFANLSRLFIMLDALGLIAFSIIGVNKAAGHDFGFVVCVIAGVITGVSGGIARDILCNKIPLVFQKELYASVSIAACILYYCLIIYTPLDRDISVILTLIFGFAFRMVAVKFELSLPVFVFDDSKDSKDKKDSKLCGSDDSSVSSSKDSNSDDSKDSNKPF